MPLAAQRTNRNIEIFRENEEKKEFRILYKTITIDTEQQNLTTIDPQLTEFVKPNDFFYIHDLTRQLQAFVHESGIFDGIVLAQIQHTSATLAVNELDEPMLLGDILRKIRSFVPREESYLHNGPLRTVNLCEEDTHCDRNADAHVKSTLFGQPSVSLIVREGELVLGQWQKIALLEFDGPRRREVMLQVSGK